MNEYIYEYRKGVGWVLEPAVRTWTTAYTTRSLAVYNVTLYDRKPEIGERYYTIERSYDDADGILDFEFVWRAINSDMDYAPEDMGGYVRNAAQLEAMQGKYVTIKTERIT